MRKKAHYSTWYVGQRTVIYRMLMQINVLLNIIRIRIRIRRVVQIEDQETFL